MATKGHVMLAEAVSPRVMTAAELARELGVTPQLISDWVRARGKPGAKLMARIEDILGIPMRAWTEETGTDHG